MIERFWRRRQNRRHAVVSGSKRPASRLKLSGLALSVVLLALGIVSWKVARDFLISHPVKHVKVASTFDLVSRNEVSQILGDYVSQNLLQVDIAAIKARFEQHPCVEWVTVARRWPQTLELRIQEKIPVARFGTDYLVSSRGELFQSDVRLESDLPVLSGVVEKSSEIMEMYQKISHVLRNQDLKIDRLSLNNLHGWEIHIKQGPLLRIDHQQPLDKLKRFAWFYQQLGDEKSTIESIDLRYHHGLAVKRYEEKNEHREKAIAGLIWQIKATTL